MTRHRASLPGVALDTNILAGEAFFVYVVPLLPITSYGSAIQVCH
jgi:hypothetical protein